MFDLRAPWVTKILRAPWVTKILRTLNPGFSTCDKCGLPWSHCKGHSVKTSDSSATFAVCEHCWKSSTLDELKEYYTQTYNMQEASCHGTTHKMKHTLEHLLECVETDYQQLKNIMNTKKAYAEIKQLLDSGLNFDYDIDNDIINKYMFSIEKKGFTIPDIILKIKKDEKIIFCLNKGYFADTVDKKNTTLYRDKERIGSIYWKNSAYGECIRISSDKGSIEKWVDELR